MQSVKTCVHRKRERKIDKKRGSLFEGARAKEDAAIFTYKYKLNDFVSFFIRNQSV